MRIWLVGVGEPLPLPPYKNRVWRLGMIARLLVQRGHQVLWWSSDWNHAAKAPYYGEAKRVQVRDGYQFQLLHSCGYSSNISLRRIIDHIQLAREFSRCAQKEPPPDLILANYPTVEICDAALSYSKSRKIPFVVDVRDQWPDLFYDVLPSPLRPILRIACSHMESAARRIFRGADAVLGNAPSAVQWALRKAGRQPSKWDRAFGMAYESQAPAGEEVQKGYEFWKKLGIRRNSGQFLVIYLGVVNSITRDLETIIRAAEALAGPCPDVKFVICGAGDDLERLRSLAKTLPNVVLPGWIDAGAIYSLLQMASIGVNPSRAIHNFEGGITNKPVEYLSAGLPVLTTVREGIMWDYLRSWDCGFGYKEGDSQALAGMIKDLSVERSLHDKVRVRARGLYEAEFLPEKVYGRFVELLESIKESRSPDYVENITV